MGRLALIFLPLIGFSLLASAQAAEPPLRVLFLTKSSGFEHSAIKFDENGTSHAGRVLAGVAEKHNLVITETKDASLISAANLANYDVVLFYTTGRLDEPGSDGNPPMGPQGLPELISWIEAGGGFVGVHSATDTFHRTESHPDSPFVSMIGGQFVAHGGQFTASLKVVSPEHPTMAAWKDEVFTHNEEWYRFVHMQRDKLHVLALLEVGDERRKQKMYDVPDYPIIWCRCLGEGRVYYNALGHREDVWEHPAYQQGLVDALRWASGQGEAMCTPNWEAVVPETKPERKSTEEVKE